MIRLFVIVVLCLLATQTWAFSPVARTDVVPYQCIDSTAYPSGFNFGVVAFSKPGISSVSCAIASGSATYTGSSPLTDTTVSLNSRTGVYEYYVTIDPADFSSDGTFTVTCTVTDNDSNTRNLSEVTMNVDHDGVCTACEAWVQGTSGNDGTGAVNDQAHPYKTMTAATAAIKTANGGSTDNCILYLDEDGTYDPTTTDPASTSSWFTIAKGSNATSSSTVIINEESDNWASSDKVKVYQVTLQSDGSADYVFPSGSMDNLWLDSCRLIGPGRWTENSNPVHNTKTYFTNNYIYDVQFGHWGGYLSRGDAAEKIGEDNYSNFPFVINCTLTDQDPGVTGWHTDAFQTYGNGPSNYIVYGYKATDIHHQGIFSRATDSAANDNAFVNVFIENRASYSGTGAGTANLYGPFDHLILWYCTFLGRYETIDDDTAGNGFTNSSFIGNLWTEYRENYLGSGPDPSYAENGNEEGNEFLENHFIYSCVDQGDCEAWHPHYYSKSPDSGNPATQSVGDAGIDTDTESDTFGSPEVGSVLLSRVSSSYSIIHALVKSDVLGNIRDANSDVGAIELQSDEEDTTAPLISNGSPSGVQGCTSDPRNITMSVTTDENATCKYHASDVAYASMGSTFSTTGTTSHSQTLSDLSCDDSYTYYVRCIDGDDNANDSSTEISFSISADALPGVSSAGITDSGISHGNGGS